MKFALAGVAAFCAFSLAAQDPPPDPELQEQYELAQAANDAGTSSVDQIRALMADRDRAVQELSEPFGHLAAELGLDGAASVAYRPRSKAATAQALADELAERTPSDLERGFTGHGPHRDELALLRAGRELRVYGSQGQQRLGLLGLPQNEICDRQRSFGLMVTDVEGRGVIVHGRR